MRDIAIKQALFIPIGAELLLMLVGLTVPGYSSVAEHMSKLGLIKGYPAMFEQVLGIAEGLSIIIFSIALIGHPAGRFRFSATISALFGLSMASNGIFPMGSPLHGLYGIGFFSALIPVLFTTEIRPQEGTDILFTASKWAAVIAIFYFWLMITGLDPEGFRGLTQRLAVIPMVGWYAYASYCLLAYKPS